MTRRFLAEGIGLVSKADPFSVNAGILLVDLACETLLKAALRHHGGHPDPTSSFDKTVNALLAVTSKNPDLSFVLALRPLRQTRNCVMHDGTQQDPAAARRLVETAQRILVDLARASWKLDLINLRLTEFVTETLTKKFLTEASERLEQGDFRGAASWARATWNHLIRRWTAFTQDVFTLREPPDDLAARIFATSFAGVYLPDLRRFLYLTDNIKAHQAMSGAVQFVDTGWGVTRSPEEQQEAAQFALDFVGGFALQIEERIPPDFQRNERPF